MADHDDLIARPDRILVDMTPHSFPGYDPCWVWHSADVEDDDGSLVAYIPADALAEAQAQLRQMREERDEMAAALDSAHAEVGSNIWRFWRDKCREMLAQRDEARARVAKLERRLEIDRVWKLGEGDELVPQIVPAEERDRMPDGIDCRNETIKLLEEGETEAHAAGYREAPGVRCCRHRRTE
jgi:hypothetical protein